jgi:hypothetical protein
LLAGFNFGGQSIEITGHGHVTPYPQTLEDAGVLDGLIWRNHDPDRYILAQRTFVLAKDGAVLGAVEIEFKDDPVGPFGQLAALPF